MSEDTAHGQHFEPGPPPAQPTNGEATGAQTQQAGKQMSQEAWLEAQAKGISELGIRVSSLLAAAQDAYQQFLFKVPILLQAIVSAAEAEEPNDNRPSDSATAQTTA